MTQCGLHICCRGLCGGGSSTTCSSSSLLLASLWDVGESIVGWYCMGDVGLYAKRWVNAEIPNIFCGVEKVLEGEGKKLYV